MTVKELHDLVGGDKQIVIRYDIEVIYSELTSGMEDVLVELDETAVLRNGGAVILAADLCKK